MPKLTAADISRLLREMGDRMTLQGGNPYRSRATSKRCVSWRNRTAASSMKTRFRVFKGIESDILPDGFSINPDAHSTEEIDNVQWGVLMARKGAVPKDRVLNTLSLTQFESHLQKRKEQQTQRPQRAGRKAR